ncbi:hypothetical protein WJR50_14075 [Catalinimonas sp. 4WD22]|uniref:hypothetical protein n=1 Tax=Catalinimonas locisalis TaxID=3133978 RepID=UPI0031011FCC
MPKIIPYLILFSSLYLISCEDIGEEEKRKGEPIDIQLLTASPWIIDNFSGGEALEGQFMVFSDDFSLQLINSDASQQEGQWAVADNERLIIRMQALDEPYSLLDDTWVMLFQSDTDLNLIVEISSSSKSFSANSTNYSALPKNDDDDDRDDDDNDDEDDDSDDNDDDDDDNDDGDDDSDDNDDNDDDDD